MKYRFVVIGVILSLNIVGCATDKEISVDNENLQLREPIPVGSANVELELISFTENSAEVMILTINGYGSSTSRLLVNDTIDVEIDGTILDQITEMSSGTTFNAMLSMQTNSMNQSSTQWVLTEILD